MPDAFVFDRPGSTLLEIVGKEAASFLHNLSTNDIKSLVIGQGVEAFFCTHTARVLGHGYVTCLEAERFWVDADPGQSGTLFKHLDKHFISEQIELTDRSAEIAALRLAGADAASLVPGAADLKPLQITAIENDVWLRRFSGWNLPTLDLFGPASALAGWRRKLLEAGCSLGDESLAETIRIESGLPKFGVDMDAERFVVELDRIPQAISYAKGCYLGQEPIVMARDRGQVNRRLLGLEMGAAEPPSSGQKVTRDGGEIGVVTSSVRSARLGQTIALAYLRRGHWEPGAGVRIGEVSARVAALPFVEAGR